LHKKKVAPNSGCLIRSEAEVVREKDEGRRMMENRTERPKGRPERGIVKTKEKESEE
jgi:hypothetical protein